MLLSEQLKIACVDRDWRGFLKRLDGGVARHDAQLHQPTTGKVGGNLPYPLPMVIRQQLCTFSNKVRYICDSTDGVSPCGVLFSVVM
jgi:hypothetical protein